jgi:hypothetical protein
MLEQAHVKTLVGGEEGVALAQLPIPARSCRALQSALLLGGALAATTPAASLSSRLSRW